MNDSFRKDTRLERIKTCLQQALTPDRLEIIDESARHAGHAGSRPEGETHFFIDISSPRFSGCSRIDQHRLINTLLAEEFTTGLHALRLSTRRSETAQTLEQ